MTTQTATGFLHWSITGTGPAVFLIPGTPGDGDQFQALAAELARTRTVICYDRRGTSRSQVPAGWTTTSVAEQAADAAAVLAEAGVKDALVYGTSNGAAIALELALRHPALVRHAVLHEMPLLSVLNDPAPVGDLIADVIGSGMAGGPRGGLEAFLAFAYGADVVRAIDPVLLGRMLDNATMVFTVELPAFQAYRPDEVALASHTVPITVAVGSDQQASFFHEAAQWLAGKLGTTVTDWPGAHGPQFTCPQALADALISLD